MGRCKESSTCNDSLFHMDISFCVYDLSNAWWERKEGSLTKIKMVWFSSLHSRYTSLSGTDSSTSFNLTFKLAAQIILLQIFYYFTALIVFFITAKLLGWDFHVDWIYTWSNISVENSFGLTLMFLWLLNTLFSVILITFFIGRSKLVWDFALTIHFINFLVVSFASGFPKSVYWWLLQLVSVSVMMILGTYMARWIELRDTFFDQAEDIELGGK